MLTNNYRKFKIEDVRDREEIYKRYHFACKVLNASKEPQKTTIYWANILIPDNPDFKNAS